MPFVANSGTYQADAKTITTKPTVALWPNFMEGGSQTFAYHMEDGEMVLTVSRGAGYDTNLALRRLK